MISDSIFLEYNNKSIEDILRDCEQKYDKPCPSREIKNIALSCVGLADGGIERVVSILCGKFADAGYNVFILSSEEPNEKDYDYSNDVERIVVPGYDDAQPRLEVLEKYFIEKKIDVVIENYWASPFLIWEILLCKEMKIPFVNYVHGNFSFLYGVNNEFTKIFHKMIRLCDAVVCLDKISEKFFSMVGGKVFCVVNPVGEELIDLDISREYGNSRILWLGRLVEGKRFEDALRIFEEVKKVIPNAEMEVVGWGKQGKKMQKLTKKMKLSRCVHFRGYQENVLDYYKNNDVFLMTSESEGYPTSLVEAKAAGIPIVMYDLPYLAINETGGGFFSAPIGNIENMASLLIDILTDRNKQENLSREGRLCFERLCNIDIIDEWNSVFSLAFSEANESDDAVEIVDILTQRYFRTFERYEEASKEIAIGRACLRIPRWVRDRING